MKVQLKDSSECHYLSVIYTSLNCFKVDLENILEHPMYISSNQIVHNILFSLRFWASDPLIDGFY